MKFDYILGEQWVRDMMDAGKTDEEIQEYYNKVIKKPKSVEEVADEREKVKTLVVKGGFTDENGVTWGGEWVWE